MTLCIERGVNPKTRARADPGEMVWQSINWLSCRSESVGKGRVSSVQAGRGVERERWISLAALDIEWSEAGWTGLRARNLGRVQDQRPVDAVRFEEELSRVKS